MKILKVFHKSNSSIYIKFTFCLNYVRYFMTDTLVYIISNKEHNRPISKITYKTYRKGEPLRFLL